MVVAVDGSEFSDYALRCKYDHTYSIFFRNRNSTQHQENTCLRQVSQSRESNGLRSDSQIGATHV